MNDFLPEDDDRISKSALKREHHGIKALGEELVALGDRQLRRLGLDDTVREAVIEGRRLKHGALQRHLRHLANLLSEHEPTRIREALNALREPHRIDVRLLHEVERWRDALMAGDERCLDDIATQCPAIDLTTVRRLASDARADRDHGRPPRHARQLFTFLRQARQASVAGSTPEQ